MTHGADPCVVLTVSKKHTVHGPPSGPEKPALQPQRVTFGLAAGESELAGQLWHGARITPTRIQALKLKSVILILTNCVVTAVANTTWTLASHEERGMLMENEPWVVYVRPSLEYIISQLSRSDWSCHPCLELQHLTKSLEFSNLLSTTRLTLHTPLVHVCPFAPKYPALQRHAELILLAAGDCAFGGHKAQDALPVLALNWFSAHAVHVPPFGSV